MDVQPVVNYCRTCLYMSDYFSKSESETPQPLLKACSEIRSMHQHARDAMHKLSSSRQVSFQEAVYDSLPELWKVFSKNSLC